MRFTRDTIRIDPATETERIVNQMRQAVRRDLRRQGGIVGVSGGVDSAVVLALSVRAFGPDRVIALLMPEKDSDPISRELAADLAGRLGVESVLEDITPVLAGFGCYRRRDEAIQRVFPQYDPAAGWKAKIVLPQDLLEARTLNVFSLVVVGPDQKAESSPLGPRDFLQITAASNLKQRTRMSMLYYHAELRNYAVIGTMNRNEHDQGFYVKFGDAGVDVKAIGHLYKTQVYQLAEYLDIPSAIRTRPPTSDTYSAPCTQEEFFFRLPFSMLDMLMFARSSGVPAAEAAAALGLTEEQVVNTFNDFARRDVSRRYLETPPLTIE
jgi:NAD+ synthase